MAGGWGVEWGAEEEEGDGRGQSPWQQVLVPTSMTLAPGRSGMLSPPRAGSNVGRPRRIPALQGPHRVYFMKGCSASLPASHTPPKCCRLPRPPLLPGPCSPRPHEPGQGLASSVLGAVPPWEALVRQQGGMQLEKFL